jgi:hypothetical protein
MCLYVDRHFKKLLADYKTQITMAILQPQVIRHRMGSNVSAVYFPQLGHLVALTDRNMTIEIPPELDWDLRVGRSGLDPLTTSSILGISSTSRPQRCGIWTNTLVICTPRLSVSYHVLCIST